MKKWIPIGETYEFGRRIFAAIENDNTEQYNETLREMEAKGYTIATNIIEELQYIDPEFAEHYADDYIDVKKIGAGKQYQATIMISPGTPDERKTPVANANRIIFRQIVTKASQSIGYSYHCSTNPGKRIYVFTLFLADEQPIRDRALLGDLDARQTLINMKRVKSEVQRRNVSQ